MTNNLKISYPVLFEEIVKENYDESFLNKLTFGSGRKLEWKCKDCQFRWVAVISDRTRKGKRASGCPICREIQRKQNINDAKAVPGVNDLQTLYPHVFKEIDFIKNKDANFKHLSYASSKRIWWKCNKCEHSWNSKISGRTQKDKPRGCPKCANITRGEKSSLATIGVNDLQSTHPLLFKELHSTKNIEIDINYLTFGSSKKVWWKCSNHSCDHEWRTSPLKRTWQETACPKCCNNNGTSKQEKDLLIFIQDFINENKELSNIKIIENDRSTIKNSLTNKFLELDIFLPELKLAFEYNGVYWHNDSNIAIRTNGRFTTAKSYHDFKSQLCGNSGIKLVHIYEENWLSCTDSVKNNIKQKIITSCIMK